MLFPLRSAFAARSAFLAALLLGLPMPAPAQRPAHDSTVGALPVDVSWQGLRAAARDAARDGTVDYLLKGSVTLDTPLGEPNVPFEEAGRFTPPPTRDRAMP